MSRERLNFEETLLRLFTQQTPAVQRQLFSVALQMLPFEALPEFLKLLPPEVEVRP